jgi:hypothetical protein
MKTQNPKLKQVEVVRINAQGTQGVTGICSYGTTVLSPYMSLDLPRRAPHLSL